IALLTSPAFAGMDAAALQADAAFFSDSSYSTLKPGVTAKDLAAFKSPVLKKVAGEMLAGSYDRTHRTASYQAYPSPQALGRELKLGNGFSRYENITGIH